MSVTILPLVCTETLYSLVESLDGESALCRSFVCCYVDMLPGRFVRLPEAVSAGQKEDVIDAALSLRSSSMMVGAARLGKLIGDLIKALETGCDGVAT